MTLPAVPPLDRDAMAAATDRVARLTKPTGSLGRLEALAIRLAGIRGRFDSSLDRRAIVVFAADHGVAARGVSAYPPEVTAQMVANMHAGGAAVNVLARAIGASLTVVDVGVAAPTVLRGPHHVADGTRDMTGGPAMTRAEAHRAIAVGRAVARDLAGAGVEVVGVGEMGIGNTTAASALTAALTGLAPDLVTGRGTGVDDATLTHKVGVVRAALDRNRPDPADPVGVLAAVGGLEVAALVGLLLELGAARVPVVLDGFITGAAALVASALEPALASRLIAGHRSTEPGHRVQLKRLELTPVLDLDLRLGEGSGAALAIPVVDAAVRLLAEMATFESAGVSNREVAGATVQE
jgi:nicotinate-nucleotide--dimethylbenzimidazole phosphoribosyltransferase